MLIPTDHKTIEEFVRALAKTGTMNSRDAGYVISDYWKDEAIAWVSQLDSPGDPCYCDSAETCNCDQ